MPAFDCQPSALGDYTQPCNFLINWRLIEGDCYISGAVRHVRTAAGGRNGQFWRVFRDSLHVTVEANRPKVKALPAPRRQAEKSS